MKKQSSYQQTKKEKNNIINIRKAEKTFGKNPTYISGKKKKFSRGLYRDLSPLDRSQPQKLAANVIFYG